MARGQNAKRSRQLQEICTTPYAIPPKPLPASKYYTLIVLPSSNLQYAWDKCTSWQVYSLPCVLFPTMNASSSIVRFSKHQVYCTRFALDKELPFMCSALNFSWVDPLAICPISLDLRGIKAFLSYAISCFRLLWFEWIALEYTYLVNNKGYILKHVSMKDLHTHHNSYWSLSSCSSA